MKTRVPLSMSLIAFLLPQASHKPGDYPTPPYPPHAHIEAAPTESSDGPMYSIRATTLANVSTAAGVSAVRPDFLKYI